MPKTLSAMFAALALLTACGRVPEATVATPVQKATVAAAAKARADNATPTGLPLDAPWKQQEYAFAVKNVKHPAWGLSHAERDLQIALALAAQERLAVDRDVLFAAAYLHDLGGLKGFEKEGVDHGVRSAELAEPLLKAWGFPMAKFPKVKDVIMGHVYYGPAPTGDEARVFHDADLLDFLGTMGVIRLLAATQDGGPDATMAGGLKTAKQFATELPRKLTTAAAREQAKTRVAEMNAFFQTLDPYTYDGNAL
ncbi:MAG: hypothetical protein JWM80_5846 [Cyanobacteria bacterium RYN_339]|nr:hypothetical protein [Cyanobacteria bacterium RYN_339]